uniref:JmjC domain-containing protein n=1 Tax=Acrobeloides nanus TaxID=290746 RepID=A0A914CX11_9BILA
MLSSEFTNSWPARKLWVSPDGQPNYEYLRTKYGKCIVPALSADGYVYEEISLEKYLDDMENCTHKAKLYLKDWHFQSTAMHKPVYDLPLFLRFDWINQESWTSDVSNPFGGDYRFVYIGAKGQNSIVML